ncbi:hypothetical protein CVT24_004420 [Panaeolus cyanescens]|uniref:Uncharacterized protein n=1 Tax=Panaeolus cyanescens TaxID=181874 RepID=A0A409VA13_9AGAR|nr:hypothetical protein CVT24_004420 [Panaeolus cyanescens]
MEGSPSSAMEGQSELPNAADTFEISATPVYHYPADRFPGYASRPFVNYTSGSISSPTSFEAGLPELKRDVTPLESVDGLPPPPSKFSDKLYTNYIPRPSEINEITEYVAAVNTEVGRLDAEVAELEAALLAVNSKRARLKEIATAHQALISPLRRLPPEILQLIFVACLPPNRNAVMHASEAPVLLGRVCSEWRRISLSTPEVWSCLHIVPPNVNFSNPSSSSPKFERKRELIQMWLSRSGACPLYISFVWFAGDSEDEVKLCGQLLEVLVPMCSRWKQLEFQVPLKMFKPFVGLTVKDVPLLEGMSLMDNRTPLENESVDKWPDSLKFAENATALKNFTLTFFSGGIRLPTIPWPHLTTLYLESNISFFFPDSKEMLSTLQNCTALEHCTLKFPLSHTSPLPPYAALSNVFTLPELKMLCIDGDQHLHNTFHMSNTLLNIVAPKLRKLEIIGRAGRTDDELAPEPLSSIRKMLTQSKCRLESLSIESIAPNPEDFIAILRLAPDLVELTVHNWNLRLPAFNSNGVEITPEVPVEVAENVIMRALTLGPKSQGPRDGNADESYDSSALSAASAGVAPIGQGVEESDAEGDAKGVSVQDSGNGTQKSHADKSPIPSAMPCGYSSLHKCTRREIDPRPQGPDLIPGPPPPSAFDVPTDPPQPMHEKPGDDLIDDFTPLCPKLERFDFTLCDASQQTFCDFVESRWHNISEGMSQLKHIKCNFTAFEDEDVKKRMNKLRMAGMDATVTYQVPMNDDVNPSPWTGLEPQA